MDKNLSDISSEKILNLHQNIGSLIKQLREEQGLSQLEVALSIGIKSVAFYSNCENSKNDKHFNVEHIYKICKILNISLSDFFRKIN